MQTSFKTGRSKRYHFQKKTLLHLLERVKTCRSNFHCFKCKERHHVCICTCNNASGNQNSYDSKNSSGDGFTQTDKQNDEEKKTTVASKNIASVHPPLNLYELLFGVITDLPGTCVWEVCKKKDANTMRQQFSNYLYQ